MNSNLRKLTFASLLTALGFILSPILRVPGMAPMQHFINVISAVLLGPWYALFIALGISFLRMSFMGINILALTGSVFGATLSGILYRKFNKYIFAVIGEIIGTACIGSIVSYPAMRLIVGNTDVVWLTYVPSFTMGTVSGSLVAYTLLKELTKRGVIDELILQNK